MKKYIFLFPVLLAIILSCSGPKPIDRYALVSRHNVVITSADTLGSLSVGNGEFAFTVDASGLQTYYKEYENGIALGTQSQWGWHRNPDDHGYGWQDVATEFGSCDTTTAPYPVQHREGRAGEATRYLRANPHRLHLGLIGLLLFKENGDSVKLGELNDVHQQLDLWTGGIESNYTVEGVPVRVFLFAHQDEDRIAVRVESPLLSQSRLKIGFTFPYGKDCHVCPGYDVKADDKHKTEMTIVRPNYAQVKHTLDSTTYFAHITWTGPGELVGTRLHRYTLQPAMADTLEFSVHFNRTPDSSDIDFTATASNSKMGWEDFWTTGGVVDFSNCTDNRAPELERRVVLSQYLTRIQCAGSMPPQETGLTMNSWYGKFHLEMHWWHAAHFPLWSRPSLLSRSMEWYYDVLPQAMRTAQVQGYKGVRWQKMTDPYGNESPSDIGAFIIWQQPHPIYMAELLYRAEPTQSTLQKYKEIVLQTAEFMASFLRQQGGAYHLCHPLIPAQEIFRAQETDDPAFELQYWHFGLSTAQEWRRRLGIEEDVRWQELIDKLVPLSVRDGMYLPNVTTPKAYEDDQFRRDHPAVVGALGMLPYQDRVDTAIMSNTFRNIMHNWQWATTWGWDYPLLAMTAARLYHPELAIDALMKETQKNTYLNNGHNFQDTRLRLYLPGNGGLLTAVGMMAAGWDGSSGANPGFPKDGKWDVRWENIQPMP